jgi:hypothetical protein
LNEDQCSCEPMILYGNNPNTYSCVVGDSINLIRRWVVQHWLVLMVDLDLDLDLVS